MISSAPRQFSNLQKVPSPAAGSDTSLTQCQSVVCIYKVCSANSPREKEVYGKGWDNNDHDFSASLRVNWCALEEVSSYEASLQQLTQQVAGRCVLDWVTHLGICPECYETKFAPPIQS